MNEEKNIKEIRTFTGTVELRMTEGEDWPTEITGVAAVVDQRADIGWFEEEIAPGAFDNALKKSDIRVLYNHDTNYVLGRTKSGTGKVWVNSEGNLAYSFEPDKGNPQHVSIVRTIQRGDVTQSSFAFTVERTEWRQSDKYGNQGTRRILEVRELYDVSPVTYPAYTGTTVGSRDADAIKAEREALMQEQGAEAEAIAEAAKKQNDARKQLAGIIAKTF